MQEKQTGTFTEGQNIPFVARENEEIVSQYVQFTTTQYPKNNMSAGCHDTVGKRYQYDVRHLLRLWCVKQVDTCYPIRLWKLRSCQIWKVDKKSGEMWDGSAIDINKVVPWWLNCIGLTTPIFSQLVDYHLGLVDFTWGQVNDDKHIFLGGELSL